MKYKLDDNGLKIVNKASDMTSTNYEIDEEDYIEVESILCALEDLEYSIENLQEEYDDLKHDMDSYYMLRPEWRDWRDEV